MSDHVSGLENVRENAKKLHEVLGDEFKGFKALHDSALRDKALSPKQKEFVALGIAIAIRCEGCIQSHVKTLVDMGASREEIAETIGVAMFMGGGPSTVYGGKALEAYDQYKKQ